MNRRASFKMKDSTPNANESNIDKHRIAFPSMAMSTNS